MKDLKKALFGGKKGPKPTELDPMEKRAKLDVLMDLKDAATQKLAGRLKKLEDHEAEEELIEGDDEADENENGLEGYDGVEKEKEEESDIEPLDEQSKGKMKGQPFDKGDKAAMLAKLRALKKF